MAYRGIVMDERVYFKGNAVIDEQLNMLEADDEIKNFFLWGKKEIIMALRWRVLYILRI